MPTTSLGLPYPAVDGSSGDNVPVDLKALADQANALIAALQAAVAGKLGVGAKAADSELLDGIDSTTFARRDQAATFAGHLDTSGGGQVREGGVRVYSPTNPPPATGAMIAQTIRGTAVAGPETGAGAATTTVTIPAVNMAKAQVRLLGATPNFANTAETDRSVRIQLVSSTQLAITAYTFGAYTVSYEITEWT